MRIQQKVQQKNLQKIVILFLLLIVSVQAEQRQSVETLQEELQLLRGYLTTARDSLQDDISKRWSMRQRYINQREVDKEDLEELRATQEQDMNRLTRLKEECFAQERTIEDERSAVQDRRDEWDYLLASMGELFEKEERRIDEAIPLDMEENRQSVNEINRDFVSTNNPINLVTGFLSYYTERAKMANQITITHEVVMPDEGDPAPMSVVRFGDVIAYALDNSGTPFVIRQTGKLGPGKYTVELIGSPELTSSIIAELPSWVEKQSVESPVMLDVLQNSNSPILISGQKVNASTRLQMWLKAGGPIMFPMIGLLVWALILVIIKLIQYGGKDKSFEKTSKTVLKHLKEKEFSKALDFSKKEKGVVAKVVTTCLEHKKWNRNSAEKAVKEILLDEVPQLNKSLATLGVIAGAAPMLGLLGTVTGMINLFAVITHYGTGDPKILAGGISEALVTTQAGLAVAIPILLIHNYLLNRSNNIQSEMQKHAVRILNRLWPVEE